ncbi:MAG TPA: aldo/keto reductase [Fimbriimonas sp.]|nr:aldo/keto reductase [Fimbriimonas sp.]
MLTKLDGSPIPSMGLGTFGSDKYSPDEVADAVIRAAKLGYRHFDCAAVYGNEKQIGAALKKTGLARREMWVTGKVWNDRHRDVVQACKDSLSDLGLAEFDLYLVHWPFPNHHAVGVGVDARDPHAVPYNHDQYMDTWRQMESLVDMGLCRHIGTSNMTSKKLSAVLKDARIKPAANEMELHPHFQQPALYNLVTSSGILPIGYSPLGSPSRPERDRTPEDSVDIEDPVIREIARSRGLTEAQVCLKWAVSRGHIPIPFSVKQHQLESNFAAIEGEPLTPEELQAIEKIDRNCRLIKGQVFLWEGAKDWTELWDGEA